MSLFDDILDVLAEEGRPAAEDDAWMALAMLVGADTVRQALALVDSGAVSATGVGRRCVVALPDERKRGRGAATARAASSIVCTPYECQGCGPHSAAMCAHRLAVCFFLRS